ncbi:MULTISPECIES: hypothetical protein [unclassified Microcoleus]
MLGFAAIGRIRTSKGDRIQLTVDLGQLTVNSDLYLEGRGLE